LSPIEVREYVRQEDARNDALIAGLRKREKAEPGWLADVAALGGVAAIERGVTKGKGAAAALRNLFDELQDVGAITDDDVDVAPGTARVLQGLALKAARDEAGQQMAAIREDVEAVARAFEIEAGALSVDPPRSTKLDEKRGLGRLVALMRGHQAQKGLDRLSLYLKRFAENMGRNREPEDVTQAHVVAWRGSMFASGMSVSNQSQHLGKCAAAFACAVSEGILPANPFKGVKPRARVDVPTKPERRAFTMKELGLLVRAVDGLEGAAGGDYALIAKTLMLTGARSGEIVGLRVRDICEEEGVAIIDINARVRSLKNKTSARKIPIPSMLRDELEQRCTGRGGKRRDGDAVLFDAVPTARPTHKFQIEIGELIRAYVSDDPALVCHSLRHGWRQKARRLKIDSDARRAIMGHALGKDPHDKDYNKRPPVDELSVAVEAVAAALWADVQKFSEPSKAS